MTLAASIFLSSLFIGCVALYIKSDSKEKWRRSLLFLVGISFTCFLSILLYLIIAEQIEKRSYKTEPQKDTSMFPTQMKGIKLGETLSDLQFKHGKFSEWKLLPAPGAEKNYHEATGYYTENKVWVIVKNGIATELHFTCPENPFDETNYFHLIRCGDSSNQVFQTYGKSEIKIRCSAKDLERRLYDIPSRRIRLIMKKDTVEQITFYSLIEPPNLFIKDC